MLRFEGGPGDETGGGEPLEMGYLRPHEVACSLAASPEAMKAMKAMTCWPAGSPPKAMKSIKPIKDMVQRRTADDSATPVLPTRAEEAP